LPHGFAIDFACQQAICPAGKASQSWTPALAWGTTPVIEITSATADCQGCALRPRCTRSTPPRWAVTLRPQAQHAAPHVRRQRGQTTQFAAPYARRAGVEGTIAPGVRSCRLRRTHYLGQAKTPLGPLMHPPR
jgi:hypothetical protein